MTSSSYMTLLSLSVGLSLLLMPGVSHASDGGVELQAAADTICKGGPEECAADTTSMMQVRAQIATGMERAAPSTIGENEEKELRLAATTCDRYKCTRRFCSTAGLDSQALSEIQVAEEGSIKVDDDQSLKNLGSKWAQCYEAYHEANMVQGKIVNQIVVYRRAKKGGEFGAKMLGGGVSPANICKSCTRVTTHDAPTLERANVLHSVADKDLGMLTNEMAIKASVLEDVLYRESKDLTGNVMEMPAQGGLGDCWMVSAISSFALYPQAIEELFPGYSNAGPMPEQLDVRLWSYSYGWTDVKVTDKLPSVNGKTKFMEKPTSNGVWPLIMEKAFAVLGTNQWKKKTKDFKGIVSGNPGDAFQTLTGNDGEEFLLPSYGVLGSYNKGQGKWAVMPTYESTSLMNVAKATGTVTTDYVWDRIKAVYENNGLLATGCCRSGMRQMTKPKDTTAFARDPSRSEAVLENGQVPWGIVDYHAYSILAVKQIDLDGYLDVCYDGEVFKEPLRFNAKRGHLEDKDGKSLEMHGKSRLVPDAMCSGAGSKAKNYVKQSIQVGDQISPLTQEKLITKPIRLLKIRNPHGDHKRWYGKWGPTDLNDPQSGWGAHSKLVEVLHPELGYNLERDGSTPYGDGAFWMEWETFLKMFPFISVNNLNMAHFRVPPAACNTNWGGRRLGKYLLNWREDATVDPAPHQGRTTLPMTMCGQCAWKSKASFNQNECQGQSIEEVERVGEKGMLCCVIPREQDLDVSARTTLVEPDDINALIEDMPMFELPLPNPDEQEESKEQLIVPENNGNAVRPEHHQHQMIPLQNNMLGPREQPPHQVPDPSEEENEERAYPRMHMHDLLDEPHEHRVRGGRIRQ